MYYTCTTETLSTLCDTLYLNLRKPLYKVHARQNKSRFRLQRRDHIVRSEVLFSSVSEDAEPGILYDGFKFQKNVVSTSDPEFPPVCSSPTTHTITDVYDTHWHADVYERFATGGRLIMSLHEFLRLNMVTCDLVWWKQL